MKQDFFTHLPPEITINILSRLPLGTTMSCSCVYRSWRDLIKTPEFVKSRLSKSVPGIAVFEGETPSKPYKIFEFGDELDPLDSDTHYYNLAFNFSFPHPELIHSSADGLMFLFDHKIRPHKLFICNPITRDYIKLPDPHFAFFFKPRPHKLLPPPPPPPPPPQFPSSSKRVSQLDTFGFGVSKMSGQYKVVRVYHERLHNQESGLNQSECQVYTLGTGSWRSIEAGGPLKYECNSVGAFLNGNFHWLVSDLELCPWISCFDFETELFSTISSPYLRGQHSCRTLSALGECLSLCDNSSPFEIVIWLMNESEDDKSWTKRFIISKMSPDDFYGVLCPIKVFKNGDVLISKEGRSRLLCYFNKTKMVGETDLVELYGYDCTSVVSYTPSLLPLTTFTNENVKSF